MKQVLKFIVVLLLGSACSHAPSTEKHDMEQTEVFSEATKDPVKNNTAKTTDVARKVTESKQHLIKNAELRFQVKDLTQSAQHVNKLVQTHKAYIASSNEERLSNELVNNIEIRVENSQFEPLVQAILQNSIYINTKNISVEDVSEQFVDIEARVKTKREVEQRYLDILKKAKNIEEIMSVESKLAQIREEIEVQEGKLKFLRDRVQFSTIRLQMYEQIPYVEEPTIGFFSQFVQSFINGWQFLLTFILGITNAWPLFIIIIGVVFAFRKWKTINKV